MKPNEKNHYFVQEEEGQALFEFIAFVPFFLVMFALFTNIIASINGSINQQKAVRGYYYHLLRGNSRFPARVDFNRLYSGGVRQEISFFTIGYQERSEGNQPVSPCYKVRSFLGEDVDSCEEPQTADGKTQFIRVYTSYGLCSESYVGAGSLGMIPRFLPSCLNR